MSPIRPIGLLARRLALFLLLSVGLAAGSAWAGTNGNGSGAKPTLSTKDYDVYITGSPSSVPPAPLGTAMLVLMGGASDIDAAFRAMIAKASPGSVAGVDAVVVRASGADDYNAYLTALGGVRSVASIVTKTRAAASAAPVLSLVANAGLVFIAGGDQSNYIKLWAGTPLETAMRTAALQRHAPLGGNSAGMAVLGQFDYSALYQSVTSAEALSNPYNRNLTLDRSLLNDLPWMAGVITDTHFVARDRMGRMLSFLARLYVDGWAGISALRGVALNENTALVIENGIGTVMGNPDGVGGSTGEAYFIRPTIVPTTVKAKTPLTFRGLQIEKRVAGGSYDLVNWPTIAPYFVSVEAGVLTTNPYRAAGLARATAAPSSMTAKA